MDLRPRHLALQAFDVVVYAAVLSGVLAAVAAPVSLAAGFGLVGVTWTLFVAGFALLAYATLRSKPTRPDERPSEPTRPDGRIPESTRPGPDSRSRRSDDSGVVARGIAGRTRRDLGGEPAAGSLQRLVGDALPSPVRLPPAERLSPALKLFVAGLGVLLTSYLLEAVLGVGT